MDRRRICPRSLSIGMQVGQTDRNRHKAWSPCLVPQPLSLLPFSATRSKLTVMEALMPIWPRGIVSPPSPPAGAAWTAFCM